MDTRRDFLKKSMLLSGATGLSGMLPASIQRAMAIDPKVGSTYLDAEHVVILMQENRSFDHAYGTLRGVRGFNDPRAVTLPDKNLIWMQTNDAGETYSPFRFNIRDTRITWMGSLPHSRSSQVDAYNSGKCDQWLNAKRSGYKQFAGMPLTMGHYTREDIPFYYALADAFTVCDQHFCSAMTSTWPNRLYMWGGTIRSENNGKVRNFIRNDIPYEEARLRTFPELLEENGISWKVYQNDLAAGGGFSGEERAWLANFICNLLEFLPQFNVKFSARYVQSLQTSAEKLQKEITELEAKLGSAADENGADKMQKDVAKKKEVLKNMQDELIKWSKENYEQLSPQQKSLFERAFTINSGDPDYHQLTTLKYEENGEQREVVVPKGDVLYQFRKDVDSGQLPAVSWLVPAQNFSDHPSAPWYGTWITSEILDILTKNPEVWKKTIFILTYDENDGYFDHVPPFVAPDPLDPATGKCSNGIDTNKEFIRLETELEEGIHPNEARQGPIGLGFRVPMIIASPWTRGGYVCSQVFDLTSSLQFLEKLLSKKLGKPIQETNITPWRRTVAGDLTAAFRSYNGEKITGLPFLEKDPHIESVYNAKFKSMPSDFKPLTRQEIEAINTHPTSSPLMPRQEKGIRPSCPLPYQLYAEGKLSRDKKSFGLTMEARNEFFRENAWGSPFNVHFPGKFALRENVFENTGYRSYAVAAGSSLAEVWPVQAFENGLYHIRVYGPNGFLREFAGSADDPEITFACEYERQRGLTKKPTGNISLILTSPDPGRSYTIEISDNAYRNKPIVKTLKPGGTQETRITLELTKSFGWYDFSIRVAGFDHFEKRYAGHVETGKESYSDPVMGKVIV